MIGKLLGYLNYINNIRHKIKMRYYRSICGSMGKNVNLYEGIRVHYPQNLFIGDNVAMNNGVWINAVGGVHIGDNTIIGPNVVIHSANHIFDRLDIPIQKQGHAKKAVVIEEDVWIAASCIILPGVRIGRGSVIGAGSVVTHDIPSYSIATGVPATVNKSRKNSNST
jgi:acetyltransferase-like isoleucine patch superfamily enzyme